MPTSFNGNLELPHIDIQPCGLDRIAKVSKSQK